MSEAGLTSGSARRARRAEPQQAPGPGHDQAPAQARARATEGPTAHAAGRTASGKQGMSLRTRLLLLQIAVTALFLLVMGIVSTALFAQHLRSQFNATILAESTRSPADFQARPVRGVAAVEVTAGPAVRVLNPGAPVLSHALAAWVARLDPRQVVYLTKLDRTFPVPSHGLSRFQLEAAARLIPPADSPSHTQSVLFVAEEATALGRQLRGLILKEMITGGALIALLAAGGQWLIGRGLGPLDRMASTANDISARGDLNARMTETDAETEVGRLGAAINTMLDRIQQAFGARLNSERKVREFAADASHELRTPLTTIRGYAELYRQGALGPEQLPGAMRRIEQEAQRMSTLVAELLELARLDRSSSLDLTETDLSIIVRDAVADAMAVEPERPISAQAPPRLLAIVDERRIRQVLANLLANVRAHTPPSTQVAVRLGPVQGGVMIEVADAGPGMSQQDAARAFDRFHRAAEPADHTAGPGDDGAPAYQDYSSGGGSGLGLSIVQAIATAHGGQAALESWPGHGTRVRIWLPARAPAPAPPA
jgi:signal transduction histidine kinase